MSKSKGTGVFLDVDADDMYGQIMAQPDEMIKILFVNNTLLSLPEIEAIMKADNPRDAKMRLAREITTIFHGHAKAKKAEENFIAVIQKKHTPDAIPIFLIATDKAGIADLLVMTGFRQKQKRCAPADCPKSGQN